MISFVEQNESNSINKMRTICFTYKTNYFLLIV